MTTEELTELERLAGLMYSIKQVSVIMGVDLAELLKLMDDYKSPEYQAYYRGLLISESEVRTSVLKLAKQGSSPAQSLAKKYFEELQIENK